MENDDGRRSTMQEDEHFDSFVREIGDSMIALQNMAYQAYRPISYDLCSRVASENEVEYHLDRMVGFCYTDQMLELFKMVCRKYWPLYPEMIASEIMLYKELIDSDEAPDEEETVDHESEMVP